MQANAHAAAWRPSGPALAGAAGCTVVVTVAAAATGSYVVGVLLLICAALFAIATHRFFLRWEIQVVTLVLVILLIPLGRYELPGNLPFNLEPYRLLVALVAAGWCASLLTDRAMKWRKIGLFGPLLALGLTILVSLAINVDRIHRYNVLPEVLKSLTMVVSYWIVLLLAASVITRRDQLELVIKALVGGGAIVGLFALIQYHTGFNIFDQLGVIPVLKYVEGGLPGGLEARGGGARVYASAQHPIALSAALVMLLPLGIYLGRRYRTKLWWTATALIGAAAFSTVARTGSTMLLAVLIVLLCLKPLQVIRVWPYVLPFLVAVHFLAPGALGGLKSAFFPEEGLIAQQSSAHSSTSSNRLADAGPALSEAWKQPYVGYGWGTRITEPANPKNNALILDNMWLSLLLETGLAGVFALLWLFGRSVRRLGRAARRDPTEHGWLLAALASSITAYGVGMFTFDSLAFVQLTFLLFMMIGLAVPAIRFANGPKENTG